MLWCQVWIPKLGCVQISSEDRGCFRHRASTAYTMADSCGYVATPAFQRRGNLGIATNRYPVCELMPFRSILEWRGFSCKGLEAKVNGTFCFLSYPKESSIFINVFRQLASIDNPWYKWYQIDLKMKSSKITLGILSLIIVHLKINWIDIYFFLIFNLIWLNN